MLPIRRPATTISVFFAQMERDKAGPCLFVGMDTRPERIGRRIGLCCISDRLGVFVTFAYLEPVLEGSQIEHSRDNEIYCFTK